MKHFRHSLHLLVAVALVALLAPGAARADDTELYFRGADASTAARPNLLLFIDNSGSMTSTVVAKPPYNPSLTYSGSCDSNKILYRKGKGSPPKCDSKDYIHAGDNTCKVIAMAVNTGAGGGSGAWTGLAAQYDSSGGKRRWGDVKDHGEPVECRADAGIHGPDQLSPNVYALDGNKANAWTANPAQAISWANKNVYTFYSANWLNWFYEAWSPPADLTTLPNRISVVKQVATNLLNSLNNINVGLMHFSSNNEGGVIAYPISDIDTARADLITAVAGLNADSWTPLSETAYESLQYWRGGPLDFGLTSVPATHPGAINTIDPSLYKSPIVDQCQKNSMVILTDGQPTLDVSVTPPGSNRLTSLPGWAAAIGANDCVEPSAYPADPNGTCLDDIAQYLRKSDLSALPGTQSVNTYTIGFEIPAMQPFLDSIASKGGGRSVPATNAVDLTLALQDIVTEVLETGTSFAAPTIAVNSFNRAESLNQIYLSVFKPDEKTRWMGNLKRYRLDGNEIKDSLGASAVDNSTGFISSGAKSYWSADVDGANAERGGAASRLPDHAARNVFTHIAGSPALLTNPANEFSTANALLTNGVLAIGGTVTRDDLINWVRGQDIQDADGDGDTAESTQFMGDPIHTQPAMVAYGGTAGSPNKYDMVAYLPTNEGMLHAINVTDDPGTAADDASSGTELWSFIPQEMLPRLSVLFDNAPMTDKDYGLDGNVRVLKYDVNQNGIVEAADGDKVYLYFGFGRGGNRYYALDVTDRNQPRLLWRKLPGGLPGVGFTWSKPAVARMKIAGATQNAQKFVLVFGGGYDDVQDSPSYSSDSVGNGVYIVDAVSGDLLWRAGGTASGADLELPAMNNSIPAEIRVMDIDGDQLADRMYAGDMGGRLWRFDIFNNQPASNLVTGGVLAKLGAGGIAASTLANTRRFYSTPDLALYQKKGRASFFNIAIGSGYRQRPLATSNQDRFYSIRDKRPFSKLTQAEYDGQTPLVDADFIDVTDNVTTPVPAGANGWQLQMRTGNSWFGEKVLAESVTINNVVIFPSFTPADGAASCGAQTGSNKMYAVRVADGGPAVDFDNDGTVEATERSVALTQSGIAAELAVVIDRDESRREPNPDDPTATTNTICMSGVEVVKRCVSLRGVVRTHWSRSGAN